jgi:hypothetical protein
MTILGVGLGYVGHQWKIVQERREVLELLSGISEQRGPFSGMITHREVELPWIRRALGDEPLHWSYQLPASDEVLAQVLSAFPEAEVVKWSKKAQRLVPVDRDSLKQGDPTPLPAANPQSSIRDQ